MIRTFEVKRFKSLVKLTLELGRINVFIGANGSGKSNLLEAVGVLGAAAFGRVDDETLLRRGVRPGVPSLYKTAFPSKDKAPSLFFGATSKNGARYEVSLWNPLDNPDPAWRYMTERLEKSRWDRGCNPWSKEIRQAEPRAGRGSTGDSQPAIGRSGAGADG